VTVTRVAVVTNGASGAAPEIMARLRTSGFVVHSLDINDAHHRGTLGEMLAALVAGGIDLLVNNVPKPIQQPALQLSCADFATSIDLGLNSTFSASREAARIAVRDGRPLTIVNVISTLALVGLPGHSAQSCTSAAVLAMTSALAAEWGPSCIRVVAVMVGPDATWLGDDRAVDDLPGVIPLGALVGYADVAAAIDFLASADADLLTGQALTIDGGWLADGWRREHV
jgi:NAD(P)-dependent dehydrogenase (short-subunit alcohol dehydrogenase family)